MLRKSILGKSNIKRNWDNLDGMNPVEMTPLNVDPVKINRTNYLLDLMTKKVSKFEDTVESKHIYQKLCIINTTRSIISLTIFLLGMTMYEYYHPKNPELELTTKTVINVWITLFSILAVIIYLYSLYIEGTYLKSIGKMSDKTNAFSYFGIYWIVFYSVLLFLHQVYGLGHKKTSFEEIYWDGSDKVYFKREFNEYLTIIQLTVHYFTFIYILLKMSHWSNPQVGRICRLNSVDNDFMFILKSILVDEPQFFSVGMLVVLLFYFSVVIRFVEQGYQRFLNYSDFATNDEFVAEFVNRGNFDNYKNCYWNMFITMSTIGYGEFNVQATFSRVFLFFISLSGLVVTSIMVVAYSNYFELDGTQNFAFAFFNALELKITMRNRVSHAINMYVKMLFCCKKRKYKLYKHYRKHTNLYLDEYKLLRNYYNQLYGPKDMDVVGISLIKIDDYLDAMLLDIYKKNRNARIKAHGMPEDNKAMFKFLFSPLTNSKLTVINEEEGEEEENLSNVTEESNEN